MYQKNPLIHHIIISLIKSVGWTFQGGQGTTTMARQIGFGVDNVLQIEMVLPNGQHVKFGPTAWEEAEGYDVPKTTSVSGTCRVNRGETEEDKWVWDMCPEDASIDFDDLWFAVRGGGVRKKDRMQSCCSVCICEYVCLLTRFVFPWQIYRVEPLELSHPCSASTRVPTV